MYVCLSLCLYVFMSLCLYVFIFWNDGYYGLKTHEVYHWIQKSVRGHQDNFAHQFCPSILPVNFAHQFCPSILSVNFARQFCPSILPVNLVILVNMMFIHVLQDCVSMECHVFLFNSTCHNLTYSWCYNVSEGIC